MLYVYGSSGQLLVGLCVKPQKAVDGNLRFTATGIPRAYGVVSAWELDQPDGTTAMRGSASHLNGLTEVDGPISNLPLAIRFNN
jgi:hypothetical protein